MVEEPGRRELLVSKGWVQAVALVVLFGFFVMGLLAYRTYAGQPPIPERVVDPHGRTVYTGKDVTAGQQVFLKNGLMEYGSIFGHGAYLGPDFTADYLRRSALSVRESYKGEGSDRAAARTLRDFKKIPGSPDRLIARDCNQYRTDRLQEEQRGATLSAVVHAMHAVLAGVWLGGE